MAVGKKARFEVFKRDKFTCQYCGQKAPDVVLNCDHIKPIAEGGADDLMNLVTSCFGCNSGKGARELSDDSVIEKQRRQIEDLQERREQLEMMVEWQRGLMDLDALAVDQIAGFWKELTRGSRLTERGRGTASDLIQRFGVGEVLEGMRIAVSKYVEREDGHPTAESAATAWEKLGGICYNRSRWKSDPEKQDIDKGFWKFEARFRENCSHYPPKWQLQRTWNDQVVPMLRAQGITKKSQEVAARLVDLCRDEWSTGQHGSYWSAMEVVIESIDPEDLLP